MMPGGMHARGLQWSKRDIKRLKALNRAPLEINKTRPTHIGVDIGGPDQSVEAVFVKGRLAGLATRARKARTD